MAELDYGRNEIQGGKVSLHESQASFRFLLANHPQPMWVYDQQTLQFLEVNEAALAHYGYSRQEFLQMRLSEMRLLENRPQLLKNVTEACSEGQCSGQSRHHLKDGRIIDVEITAHSL